FVALLELAALQPPPAPLDVEAEVHRDPIGPGEERRVPLEGWEVAVDPYERLLGNVHGFVGILRHAQRELHHAALVSLHQRAKGTLVAFLRRPDQGAVVAGLLRTLAHTDVMDGSKFTGVPGQRQRTKKGRSGKRGLRLGNPRRPNLV